MVVNPGKVGKSGHWEPGKINFLLGRQLECGQRPWYVTAWLDLWDEFTETVRGDILGQRYWIEVSCEATTSTYEHYNFKNRLTRRGLEKTIREWGILYPAPKWEITIGQD